MVLMCHIIQMKTTSSAFGNCKDQLYIALHRYELHLNIPCFHTHSKLRVVKVRVLGYITGHGSFVSHKNGGSIVTLQLVIAKINCTLLHRFKLHQTFPAFIQN
jgi:hypothetical protein